MDVNHDTPSGPEAPEAPREKLPSFGTRLMAILVEPKVVFDHVAKRNDFWLPYITLAILMIVANALMLPTSTKSQSLIASVTGQQAPEVNVMGYVKTMVSAPFGVVFGILLMAFIIWLVMTFTSGGAPFGRAMSVAAWCTFPGALTPVPAAPCTASTCLISRPMRPPRKKSRACRATWTDTSAPARRSTGRMSVAWRRSAPSSCPPTDH